MAEPNSKDSLKSYIKRALGAPVLEINVDDDQLDDRVDEALQYFREYHYSGSVKMYLKHQLGSSQLTDMRSDESFTEAAAGTHDYTDQEYKQQKNYLVLPEYVLAVLNVFPFADKHNLNMFDLRYQLRLNDIYDLTNTSVLYYEQVQQHISLLDRILVGRTPISFNAHMNRLYLHADIEQFNANEFIIIECYRKLDPTDFTDIYNDMWLKKYATAKVKYQWGENLAKFQGIALPGGVTLDGSQMKAEAQEEITRLEEEARLNHDMMPMDIMG